MNVPADNMSLDSAQRDKELSGSARAEEALPDYELLDFGDGRVLERFGPHVLDRPAPAAASASRQHPQLWSRAAARYERGAGETGNWSLAGPIEQPWRVHLGSFKFEIKLGGSGQVGVFAEQVDNWRWIAEQVRRQPGATPDRPLKVLNLFAYTGGSTLAAAAAGAEVVHVDAAANVVAWARRNAQASGLADAPIRWIAEDALKFVKRELARGNRYDAVILDPPAYGHGPRGESWKLADSFSTLVDCCLDLTAGRRQFLLITCHTGELARGAGLLAATLDGRPQLSAAGAASGPDLYVSTSTGQRLRCGAAVRFTEHEER